MAARSRMFAPDFQVQKRRVAEAERLKFEDQTRTNRKLLATATWEASTDKAIDRNAVTTRVATMKHAMQRDLEERRQRLAQLLDAEERQYQAELEALDETTVQRAQRLKARARELVRRREEERREFAHEQLTRQFRDTNDQFRSIDSHRLLEGCLADRERAIQEKAERQEAEKKDNAYWHEKWMESRDKKIEREKADQAREMALRADMMHILAVQIDELNARRAEAQRLKEEDAAIMKEQHELAVREAKDKEEARRKMFEVKKVEMNEDNQRLRALKAAQRKKEQDEDLALLTAMLDRERAAEAKETAYKQRISDQAKEYRQQLVALMQKEAVSEAESNAIRAAEQEKAVLKRELEWEKEREYRKALMADVLRVRQEQLEELKLRNQLKREEAHRLRIELQQELEEMALEDKAAREDRDFVRLEHKRELLAQIKEHREQLDREARIEQMEKEAARKAEQDYLRAVEMEMQTQRPLKYHGIKTFGWAT